MDLVGLYKLVQVQNIYKSLWMMTFLNLKGSIVDRDNYMDY